MDNRWKDARELIITDSQFGYAAVDFANTNQHHKELFYRLSPTTSL